MRMKKIIYSLALVLIIQSCKYKIITIDTNVPSTIKIENEIYESPVEVELRLGKEYIIEIKTEGYINRTEKILTDENKSRYIFKLEKTKELLEQEKKERYDRLTKDIIIKSNLHYYSEPHNFFKKLPIKDDTKINILSRSKWSETINKETSYWLKIELDKNKAWIKSYELNKKKDYSIVIVDDILEPKKDSILKNGSIVEAIFPQQNLKVYSLPNVINEPNTKEPTIFYSNENYSICLYNYPIPKNSIEIELISESGINLRQKMMISDYQLRVNKTDPYTGFPLNNPITMISYYPYATYSDSIWNIKLIIDNDRIIEEKISLPYNKYSISDNALPNPFKTRSGGVYKVGDKIHFWGNKLIQNSELYVVLYKISNEQNEDLSFVINPKFSFKVNVNYDGNFYSTLLVGNDLEVGEYKIAYGYDTDVKIDLWGSYFVIE